MAGSILRKAGVVLITILKIFLQVILFLFKLIMTAAKAALVLFTLVLRIFLVMMGVSIRE
ncbi:MAG: hypothetical protein K2G55_10175 [Lachnospiraceae bacterium]|nr:hypothetical protein [Lachnospiraceae bacterium]MDE7202116.1 hypothetical protein [Lachnospiraceae bacterium]